jgi:hypothetical protein
MRVAARIEELHIYPHFVSSLLHAAFENCGHAEFAGHCLQVFRFALILHCRRTRDDLQVADAGEFGQDLALNAVGEIGIVWVTAQIFERQDRDALVGDHRGRVHEFLL